MHTESPLLGTELKDRETAQLVISLSCKPDFNSLETMFKTNKQTTNSSILAHSCNTNTGAGREDQRIPGACPPASLTKFMSSRFRRGPASQNKVADQ